MIYRMLDREKRKLGWKTCIGKTQNFFFFWSRGLWPLEQTHLTVFNWANQETIFHFSFFVRVEGWGLLVLVLGGEEHTA